LSASSRQRRSARRCNADLIEKGAAGVAVRHHAEPYLQFAHRVAQLEIEVAVEIGDLVAERR
jgi:hypothetical protein